jgi:hypothetical protein
MVFMFLVNNRVRPCSGKIVPLLPFLHCIHSLRSPSLVQTTPFFNSKAVPVLRIILTRVGDCYSFLPWTILPLSYRLRFYLSPAWSVAGVLN